MDILLLLYCAAGLVGIALLVTRTVRSRRGRSGPVHDRYEAAFLHGGPARVVDTALATLQGDGRIAVGGPGIVAVLRSDAHDPVERAVFQELAAAPHGALHHLRIAVMRHPAVQEIGDGLAERGLIVTPAARRTTLRWCGALGLTAFVSFPVAVALTMIELSDAYEMPVPFVVKVLPVLLLSGVTAVSCAAVSAKQTTGAGQRAALAYVREHGHLADSGNLVASHGLRALPDAVLREQLLAAARVYAPRRRQHGSGQRNRRHHTTTSPSDDLALIGVPAFWCAENSSCGGGGGGGGGGSCSGGSSCSSGGSCSGGGSSCGGGGGSSCGGGSSSSSGSSSSGSSCGSSSG